MAKHRLTREHEALQAIFDSVPAAIFYKDTENRFLCVNQALAEMMGVPKQQLEGRSIFDLFPAEQAEAFWRDDQAVIASGKPKTNIIEPFQVKTEQRWAQTDKLPYRDATGMIIGVLGFSLDITERRRAEQRGQILADVSAQLLANDQPERIMESLCRQVCEHLGCQVFLHFLLDEDSGRLHLHACSGIPDEMARTIEWLDHDLAGCGCAAQAGRPVMPGPMRMTSDPRAEVIRALGIQAHACHVLMNQGRVMGTLCFGSWTKPAFSEDELRLMQTVSDQIALALQRCRLLEASEKHARGVEAANVARDQFLANISHELRTPMTGILGMTELALRAELSANVRDYLETAKASAEGLLELLNQLRDFSRLATDTLPLEASTFHLRSTVNQTLKSLGMRASEKGLELVCDLPEAVPDRLVGDPLRLRQILTNLVDNAIKFTARGEVVLRVTPVPLDADGGREAGTPEVVLHFVVSDTGIGVSPEDQERIFTPFTQAETSPTRQFGGTGLGLAIASSLVHLMGGRTWVESVVGRGSRFHFTARFGLPSASVATLPAETVDVSGFHDERALGTTCPCEPLAITEACRDASTNLSRHRRLLLAEDTVANQKLVSAILEERGHAVYIASNGRAAVEMLQQQNFDLVLMDIQMPVMDGFQATAAIRALPDPAKSRLPIVALTAYAMAHDRERCLTAGMDAYLTKPVASQELIEVVECLAGQSSAGQAVQAPSPTEPQIVLPAPPTKPIESADPAEPVFDFAAVMKHLGGRERLFQEMVAYLGIQAPEIFVEIRRAEEAEDADALGRAAHALKGTLVYLAAAPAVAAAERVEQLGRAGDLAAAGPACRYLEQEVARLQLALAPYHAASWEPHTVT